MIRFDEDISLKANKLSLTQIKKDLAASYFTKKEFTKTEKELEKRMEKSEDEVKHLE